MRITYTGDFYEAMVVGVGHVKRGETYEVEDEMAESLMKQYPNGWKRYVGRSVSPGRATSRKHTSTKED